MAVNVIGEYQAEGLTQLHLSVKDFARVDFARAWARACGDGHDRSRQGARVYRFQLF